jgi:hypothetical protein
LANKKTGTEVNSWTNTNCQEGGENCKICGNM